MNTTAITKVKKNISHSAIPARNFAPQRRIEVPQLVDEASTSAERLRSGLQAEPRFRYDFSQTPVNSSTQATAQQVMESCPLALSSPRACPFGGACHACPPRVQAKLTISQPGDEYEREADHVADFVMRMPEGHANVDPKTGLPGEVTGITLICSRTLDAGPLFDLPVRHTYIEDPPFKYALFPDEESLSISPDKGSIVAGCAHKTDKSPDPQGFTPVCKFCEQKKNAKESVTDCLRRAYNSYKDPTFYSLLGPNCNTFTSTLAKACCEDFSNESLVFVPGWGDPPAPSCSQEKKTDKNSPAKHIHRKRRYNETSDMPGNPSFVSKVLNDDEKTWNATGKPLDSGIRAFMEARFGFDFSRVQVHTSRRAGELAQALNARALTVGRHIVFAPGQYMPMSREGNRLLAHELTHVLQQGAGSGRSCAASNIEAVSRGTFRTRPSSEY